MTDYKYRGHHHAYGIRSVPKRNPGPSWWWPRITTHVERRLERAIRRAARKAKK